MNYVILGKGRLGLHLKFFLEQHHPVQLFSAQKEFAPAEIQTLHNADIILMCVPDDAILAVSEKLKPFNKPLVHFSGCKSFDGIYGAHPLMTFSPALYDLEFYKKIYFVIDFNPALFAEFFPNFQHCIEVDKNSKALYHAFCVISGNFIPILWQQCEKQFQMLNIPIEAAHLYWLQVVKNYYKNPTQALTGPFVRNDIGTINLHKAALKDSPFLHLYELVYNLHHKQ